MKWRARENKTQKIISWPCKDFVIASVLSYISVQAISHFTNLSFLFFFCLIHHFINLSTYYCQFDRYIAETLVDMTIWFDLVDSFLAWQTNKELYRCWDFSFCDKKRTNRELKKYKRKRKFKSKEARHWWAKLSSVESLKIKNKSLSLTKKRWNGVNLIHVQIQDDK